MENMVIKATFESVNAALRDANAKGWFAVQILPPADQKSQYVVLMAKTNQG